MNLEEKLKRTLSKNKIDLGSIINDKPKNKKDSILNTLLFLVW